MRALRSNGTAVDATRRLRGAGVGRDGPVWPSDRRGGRLAAGWTRAGSAAAPTASARAWVRAQRCRRWVRRLGCRTGESPPALTMSGRTKATVTAMTAMRTASPCRQTPWWRIANQRPRGGKTMKAPRVKGVRRRGGDVPVALVQEGEDERALGGQVADAVPVGGASANSASLFAVMFLGSRWEAVEPSAHGGVAVGGGEAGRPWRRRVSTRYSA